MAIRSVCFRWDEEFVARVDEARGDVPRSAFVRRAVEKEFIRKRHDLPPYEFEEMAAKVPPGHVATVPAYSGREFRPYPKGGKR